MEFNSIKQQETGYNNLTTVSSDLEIVNGDKLGTLLVTTGSNNINITLTATENNRVINIKKIDSGSGSVIFIGAIDGDTDKRIGFQNTSIKIQYDSNGSQWRIL